uniref:Proclotting enzyme n=1 Tax=Apis cerana TaxID=7461 RepID=V9IIF8_APICE
MVKQIHAHPKFSRVGFYNDIAVLELTRTVRKSPYVIPICLPQAHYRNERFAGARPTVVGWGTTYYGGKESTVQRQAVLPVWRNEDCNAAYFNQLPVIFFALVIVKAAKMLVKVIPVVHLCLEQMVNGFRSVLSRLVINVENQDIREYIRVSLNT